MGYCTIEDLIGRFGEREMVNLSDKGDAETPHTGELNEDVVQLAIDDASAEIDSYLANCYDVASVRALVDGGTTIPRLVAMCADIARYRLYDSVPLSTTYSDTTPHRRYQQALKDLQNICGGVLVDVNGTAVSRSGVGAGGMRIAVSARDNLIPNMCSEVERDPDAGLS